MAAHSDPLIRFWAKVEKTETCWNWLGSKKRGYGQFQLRGIRKQAHRLAYEQLVGPIPEGLVIDHLCKNPSCVNPAHLEPVTQRENVHRGDGYNKTHCQAGHELTDDNLYRWKALRYCLTCRKDHAKKTWKDWPSTKAKAASRNR